VEAFSMSDNLIRPRLDHTVRRATSHDRPVLERLWLLFRHDLSLFTGALPHPDGTFRSERLAASLTESGWAAFLAHQQEAPVGFALVRSLDRPPFVLSSFFVVAGVRGSGLAGAFARDVLAAFPGSWEVAFQEPNAVAARFWRRVAAAHDDGWSEVCRAVPDRPDLPPDSWVTFDVRPG
jgi:predicted acetyltransferase